MAEKIVRTRLKPSRKTYIREWREYRGHTLEELAEMIGVTAGAISNVERMASGYTQGMLEALAAALVCEPGDLLQRDPMQKQENERIVDTWTRATTEQRQQIEQMARIIVFGKAA